MADQQSSEAVFSSVVDDVIASLQGRSLSTELLAELKQIWKAKIMSNSIPQDTTAAASMPVSSYPQVAVPQEMYSTSSVPISVSSSFASPAGSGDMFPYKPPAELLQQPPLQQQQQEQQQQEQQQQQRSTSQSGQAPSWQNAQISQDLLQQWMAMHQRQSQQPSQQPSQQQTQSGFTILPVTHAAQLPTTLDSPSTIPPITSNAFGRFIPQLDGHVGDPSNFYDADEFDDDDDDVDVDDDDFAASTSTTTGTTTMAGTPAQQQPSSATTAAASSSSSAPSNPNPPVAINESDDLNSGDDIEEHPEPETDNLILCYYTKVTHRKNKTKKKNGLTWKCNLRAGIMFLNGRDSLFSQADGEFEVFEESS